MGGISWEDDERRPLEDYWLGLTAPSGRACSWCRPPSPTPPTRRCAIVSQLQDRAQASFVRFFPWPPDDLRELALAQDAIYVSGGNTANVLAIWRVHGFDAILREAWEAGIVLRGLERRDDLLVRGGRDRLVRPQLEGMRDGLGFLPGSACPHYDGEGERRPVTRGSCRRVPARARRRRLRRPALRRERAGGGGHLAHRPRAYRVSSEGEEPIEPRRL